MSAQPIEERMTHLEGAYEQTSKRLDSIDRRLDGIDRRLDALDRKIEGNFKALLSWMMGQTAIILAAIAAAAFALHR
ncbi:MAG TPA: hypothetical protein VIN40_03870 [Candidatus Tyrphobacter sp.]